MSTAQKPEPARPILGIDLGTTYSLAAVMGKRGPIVLRAADGEALIPSVVAFREDGSVLTGRAARDLQLVMPTRVVHSVKRLIGRAGAEVEAEAQRLPYRVEQGERGLARVVIGDRRYSPEELSAMVLREVRTVAEAALGQPVEEAVVTVPAYFDDAQRQATKDAAALAGLRLLRIVNEPTAAALAYGVDGSKDGVVVVYDLGGGTFDVSILKIEGGVFRVLATAGDTHLGGDDIDRLVGERILAAVRTRLGAGATGELTPFVRQAVRRAAEGLKIRLSQDTTATLHLELGELGTLDFTMTRAELEELMTPMVEQTLEWLRHALRDAALEWPAVDRIVLVGGSTRIPLVRRRLAEASGKPPSTDVDPDLAVAMGAAIQGDILAGGNRSVLLLDVIPLSLGIETLGGVVSKLILRNATIPCSRTELFSTQVDGQTSVDVNIYQGERELVRDCRHLGSFKLRGIPPMPAGLPRVAVTFLVDADGVLRVTAKEERTGVQASIQVVPSFGLTREEVSRMMRDSIERAEEDVAARESIDLRNKARAVTRGTRAALQLATLPPDQTWSIKKAVERVEALIETGAVEALHAAVEDLSQRTAQVADDVIGSAVKKALGEER